MKSRIALIVVAFSLTGCATSSYESTSSIGQFVMAGPVNADGDVASMQWQYGMQLTVDPKTISSVKFSCSPIPGSNFTAKGSDLKVLKDGSVFIEGPVLVVSNDSTPWLFENSTTTATCKALISRSGQADSVVQAPVRFPPSQKMFTVEQLRVAHEWNKGLKKNK